MRTFVSNSTKATAITTKTVGVQRGIERYALQTSLVLHRRLLWSTRWLNSSIYFSNNLTLEKRKLCIYITRLISSVLKVYCDPNPTVT